jgi:hypothetical protein
MSLIGLTLLSEVSKYAPPDQPQKILEEIDLRLHHLLHEKSSALHATKVWDTIDLALVVIDEKTIGFSSVALNDLSIKSPPIIRLASTGARLVAWEKPECRFPLGFMNFLSKEDIGIISSRMVL